jgi:chloramphenicol 3-O phosphotransferase
MGTVEGRVVVLNGVSSAGKTTLAEAFCAQEAARGDFWFVTGIDDFLAKLPPEWHRIGDHHGRYADDGFIFEATPAGVEIRLGPVGQRLSHAYHETVAAIARAGVNVLVDEVVLDRANWEAWVDALAGLDVTWVAVRCDVEVAVAREAARGDRFLGLARSQSATVHAYPRYDVEVDTTRTPPEQVLADLTGQLTRRSRPSQ